MALFKPFRGTRATLPQELHDGYAYFCTDDGTFHIDYVDDEGNLHRKQINAKDAETLMGASLAHILNANELEIPSSKAVLDALNAQGDSFKDAILLKDTSITMPISANWTSIAYGDGKFVATRTSNSNTLAYSTDGITWNTASLTSAAHWNSVVYGNGKFVAVARNNGAVAYSTDGVNWISATMPSAAKWVSIAYGNGKFVAISMADGHCAYSEDGINWTSSTLTSTKTWNAIVYGNGIFVIVGSNSGGGDYVTPIAYSTDGINWIEANVSSISSYTCLAYGDGMFVALPGNKAAISTDGINWESVAIPSVSSSESFMALSYGCGKFVAIGFGSNTVIYSSDGINWGISTMPSSAQWISVTYGDNKFVAVAQGSDVVAVSTDGINWTNNVEYISDIEGTDITEHVKNIVTANLTTTEAVQSDWSVNDPSNQAYVKNRPFYESDPITTTLVEEQSLGFINSSSIFYVAQVNVEFEFDKNTIFKIVWDNTEYNLQAIEDEGTWVIGDTGLIEGIPTDGQPPFLIIIGTGSLTIGTLDTSASHIVSILCHQTEITTLSSKFLSDDVLTLDNFLNVNYTAGKMVEAEYGTGEIFNDYINNQATGSNSHAEGYATQATNYNAHAEGSGTTASGHTSHAEGSTTVASGQASHAEGYKTKATGWNTHAEGQDTEAVGRSQHVQGEYNIVDQSSSVSQRGKYVHIVGNGNSANARSNAHTLDWSGNAWFKGNVKVGGTGQDDTNAKTLATTEDITNAHTWSMIYDSGETTAEVNSFANINVAGYQSLRIAIKCVQSTNTESTTAGAVTFTGENGTEYSFASLFGNLINATENRTSGAMARFSIVDGFIICEDASRGINADGMLSTTEGEGSWALATVGCGLIMCNSPIATMSISTTNNSATHFYGVGSRVIVWGCKA